MKRVGGGQSWSRFWRSRICLGLGGVSQGRVRGEGPCVHEDGLRWVSEWVVVWVQGGESIVKRYGWKVGMTFCGRELTVADRS